MSKEKNIFVAGPQATGEAFIGRKKEIDELAKIFTENRSVHLMGPTRIGKSSLRQKVLEQYDCKEEKAIKVVLVMSESDSAFSFFINLVQEIKDQMEDAGIWSLECEEKYKRDAEGFDNALEKFESQFANNDSSGSWYSRFCRKFLNPVFRFLKDFGYRLILVIDEFDTAIKIFNNESTYFQLLRSIYSESDKYSTSGVIITRNSLDLLEASCQYASTFHGVFSRMTLSRFSEEDMEKYYEVFSRYGITWSPAAKEQLEYFSGCTPYICSMLGQKIVDRNEKEPVGILTEQGITDVFKECGSEIDKHYEDLIREWKKDDYFEKLYCICAGINYGITDREKENLQSMGLLVESVEWTPEGDKVKRYIVSQDFMDYFTHRPLSNENLKVWETFIACELKIKELFLKKYPKLGNTYRQFLNDKDMEAQINKEYAGLKLDWEHIRQNASSRMGREDASDIRLVDTLSLKWVVWKILKYWDDTFSEYFKKDSSFKNKLSRISDLRIPLFHPVSTPIDEKELKAILGYCKEVLITLENQLCDSPKES